MFNRIVVGVDSSPSAQVALRWAVREALRRECQLLVVTAWPEAARHDPEHGGARVDEWRRRWRAQREQVRAAREEVAPGARLRVRREIVPAEPVEALCRLVAAADLLVVGTDQPDLAHSSLSGRLSRAARARRLGRSCPLVVVPPPLAPQGRPASGEQPEPAPPTAPAPGAEQHRDPYGTGRRPAAGRDGGPDRPARPAERPTRRSARST